ncbi:hypothetical protein OS493_039555, partial [Desmophyllum pertusum]
MLTSLEDKKRCKTIKQNPTKAQLKKIFSKTRNTSNRSYQKKESCPAHKPTDKLASDEEELTTLLSRQDTDDNSNPNESMPENANTRRQTSTDETSEGTDKPAVPKNEPQLLTT